MGDICRKQGSTPIAINGMEDHVHLLLNMSVEISVAGAVNIIKTNSSKWMSKQNRSFGYRSGFRQQAQTPADQLKFAWQRGYGAFAVSPSDVASVTKYIRQQEQYHRNMTYEQEFIVLLELHGLKFNPKRIFR